MAADIDDLLNLLTNGSPDDPDAGWKAAIDLADIEGEAERERVVNALLNVLVDNRSHALIRAHAVETLGRMGDARATSGLIAAMKDPYRLVRAYATGALAQVGEPQPAIDAFLEMLENDPFYGARAEAAAAAGYVASRQQEATLRQRVREALLRRREIEVANAAPGTERVIAEIDRNLNGRLAT